MLEKENGSSPIALRKMWPEPNQSLSCQRVRATGREIEGRKAEESLQHANVIRGKFTLGISRNKNSICMLCPHAYRKVVRKIPSIIAPPAGTVTTLGMRRRCLEAGLEIDTHAAASTHSATTHLANFLLYCLDIAGNVRPTAALRGGFFGDGRGSKNLGRG